MDDFPLDEDFDDDEEEEEGEFPGDQDPNEMIAITPENLDLVIESLSNDFPMLERSFFEGLAKSLLGQEMSFIDLMSKIEAAIQEEVDKGMQQLTKEGDMEMGVDEKTGDVVYWLTPQGEAKAKEFEKKIIEEIKKEFPGLAGDDAPDAPKEE
jgi:hypothetical protein